MLLLSLLLYLTFDYSRCADIEERAEPVPKQNVLYSECGIPFCNLPQEVQDVIVETTHDRYINNDFHLEVGPTLDPHLLDECVKRYRYIPIDNEEYVLELDHFTFVKQDNLYKATEIDLWSK